MKYPNKKSSSAKGKDYCAICIAFDKQKKKKKKCVKEPWQWCWYTRSTT